MRLALVVGRLRISKCWSSETLWLLTSLDRRQGGRFHADAHERQPVALVRQSRSTSGVTFPGAHANRAQTKYAKTKVMSVRHAFQARKSSCTSASASESTSLWPTCSSPFALYMSPAARLHQLLKVLLFGLRHRCRSLCTCLQLHACISF